MKNRKIVILGNAQEWCRYSLKDFEKYGAKIINEKFPIDGVLRSKLVRLHYSKKINKLFPTPLKRVWYRSFANYISKEKYQPIVIIIYDWNRLGTDKEFLRYLKNYYHDVKLVYVFTNIVQISGAYFSNFISDLPKFYDYIFAFDPEDAKKYGFLYSPLIYSLNMLPDIKVDNDVFYVGSAKDRLNSLISINSKLIKLGKRTSFYIVGVSDSNIEPKNGIIFNTPLTYGECLKNIQSSKCLVDVIQGNSSGFTIKVCEAVYYNKLLITTNEKVKELPFYDDRFMKVISKADEIDPSFFEFEDNVIYDATAKDYFSVDQFLRLLDSVMN